MSDALPYALPAAAGLLALLYRLWTAGRSVRCVGVGGVGPRCQEALRIFVSLILFPSVYGMRALSNANLGYSLARTS